METVVVDRPETVLSSEDILEKVAVEQLEHVVVADTKETTVLVNERDNVIQTNVEVNVVVVGGTQGIQGPPGPGAEEGMYSKRTDFVSDTVLYRGEAAAGSSTAAPVWRIRQITTGIDGDVVEIFAEGVSTFDKVWDNRLTYTYI